MIKIEIPGRDRPLEIVSVVLDFNGTIARDGQLLPGAADRIQKLSKLVSVYILTADTYGTVRQQCMDLDATVKTFPRAGASACKAQIVQELGGKTTAAVGNGFNDIRMFDAAELSIAVLEKEGMCGGLLSHADVLAPSPEDALDLLLQPNRLRATLRS